MTQDLADLWISDCLTMVGLVKIMIEVLDRVPTYPGRVKMTPVPGQENTYDMVRADDPIEAGTPINKALFWKKKKR